MPEDCERGSPVGRDAAVPAWLAACEPRRERPRFDSVVIRGSGIGALTCAARLARSESLRGRVRIAGPLPVETRQLVNGCTLRARSLDYFAAAFGADADALLDSLFGARREVAETWSQRFAIAKSEPTGIGLGPLPFWMGNGERGPTLAYGLRNGHLAARLAERVQALGVPFDGDVPDRLDACLARADGLRPLVVNGSHAPLADLPPPARPQRFVVASQLTLRRRADAPRLAHSSAAIMRRRGSGFDMGIFYPFVDPLTPEADFYGIAYRIVRPGVGFDKPGELASMREAVGRIGDALGLDPIDAEATRGEAMVPCLPWRDVPGVRPDWLDLHRTYSACTPIITGDGMTRAALAGWLAAELILAGEDPVRPLNTSLRLWRRTNRGLDWVMTHPRWMEPLLRRMGAKILGRTNALPDTWAAVA